MAVTANKKTQTSEKGTDEELDVWSISCVLTYLARMQPVAKLSIATGHDMQIYNCLGQLGQL